MYKVEYHPDVLDDLKRIPKNIQSGLKRAIEERIAVDPIRFGKSLKGNWASCYRLRVANYRIIYEVQQNICTVLIIKIGTRSDVY